ncbi:unnamed protein product (macronuclear) [Paramecium tetraurelia]|uniref:Uncharacterized protein n=1 Tax=Paramecium tetraurelia TaxID=5888 RepID=A0DFD4_PARTE|nr:uncharacterized protein GSPATT00016564001 [Paramecium tetraurelia]CAK81751.1 unnamed protein product [Paramecium tetraurelia]|eukprot:XP_001449148.1 hypothetical protein (macronuclear) [Paramecium tetraurelia strain d4-2]
MLLEQVLISQGQLFDWQNLMNRLNLISLKYPEKLGTLILQDEKEPTSSFLFQLTLLLMWQQSQFIPFVRRSKYQLCIISFNEGILNYDSIKCIMVCDSTCTWNICNKTIKGLFILLFYIFQLLLQVKNKWACMRNDDSWVNKILGFDNLFDSALTQFITATTEAWLPIFVDKWSFIGTNCALINNSIRWWAICFQMFFYVNVCSTFLYA